MKYLLKSLVAIGFSMVCSCSSNISAEDILTAQDERLWDMHITQNKRARWTYRFNKDGTCIRYIINKDSTISLYNGDDIVLSNRWYIREDTLSIDEIRTQILYSATDTLILKNIINEKLITLVKSTKRRISL